MLEEMQKILDEEEKSDNDLRRQYGEQQWNRKDSASLNAVFRF
jgi:hypothetical protein